MKEGIRAVKQLSIVIALDEREKGSLPQLLEHLLDCLDLLGKGKFDLTKALSLHCYLLLTKTDK